MAWNTKHAESQETGRPVHSVVEPFIPKGQIEPKVWKNGCERNAFPFLPFISCLISLQPRQQPQP